MRWPPPRGSTASCGGRTSMRANPLLRAATTSSRTSSARTTACPSSTRSVPPCATRAGIPSGSSCARARPGRAAAWRPGPSSSRDSRGGLLARDGEGRERAEEREVVVGPELRTRLAADNLELPNALKGQRFVLLPAITGRDLLRQVLREIGGVAAEEHGPTLG